MTRLWGRSEASCGIALAARRCHRGRGEVGKGLRILHEMCLGPRGVGSIFDSAAFLNFGVRKKPRGFSPLMLTWAFKLQEMLQL